MMDQILSYIDRGWAIFPCMGKTPLTKHGYQDASKDRDKVIQMFNGRNVNVGIATGFVSGFFVVDIDIKKGEKGEESITELEREYGELPHTVQARTWSGGRHLFFRYPNNRKIGCKTKRWEGIDIRADGGYVIAPPSIIETKPYEWIADHHPDETMIADAPDWFLDLLDKNEQAVDLSDTDAKIIKNRNDTLIHIGVKFRKMGLDFPQIEAMLISINDARCSPPLSKKEVSAIAKSVSRYGVKTNKITEPLTDVWNANFFIEKFGNDVRYCDALGGWFIWDGTRWNKDDTFQIVSIAGKAVKQMYDLARDTNDTFLFKHAVKTENESKLKAMINLARSRNITLQNSDFDKDVFFLNCKNGTLNLVTGELQPHNRNDYITRRVELDFIKDAECPTWESFLESIFLNDKELIRFMQKAIGYALSGSMKEQCIFILFGVGMNGKSTFLKHVYRILGDYAMSTPASTLMEKYTESIPNDVARLKGARLVTAVESGKNKALAESQIKQLTGDDPITARFLHREYFDFFATFKIFLATNHKPNISGTDKGIWRRIRTIPFDKVITERDSFLDEKLAKEYTGILAWAVKGFELWQEEGLGIVRRINDATTEYQEDSDLIGNFIEERCVVGEQLKSSSSVLLKMVQEWARDNGARSITRNEFLDYMKKRGFKKDRLSTSSEKGKVYWFGIGLKSEASEETFWENSENERPF